jgi:protein involved in polysaccharide export with SLBB domain
MMKGREMTAMIMKSCSCLMLLLMFSTNAPARQAIASTSGGLSDDSARGDTSQRAIKMGSTERNPRYLLRPTDVLQISFPITPEFDQSVTVQPDGYISLRGIGDLHIAGKSLPELSDLLHMSYGAFLHDPVINIELKDFEKPYFTAGGQFGRPGKYELRGDTTVAEAVAMAGGFTDAAKHSEVLVFHQVPGGWEEAKRLNVKEMMAKGNLSEDMHVRPGDLIYVPKNVLSKIRQFIPNMGMGMTIP